MDNLSLNIVFMPPKEVVDYATWQCNKITQSEEVSFNLDGISNFPHITIYQLNIPRKNLDQLILKLGEVAKKTNPQVFKFTDYEVHAGYLGASFSPSREILEVQRQIVDAISELREGLNVIEVESEEVSGLPAEQKELVKEFGFDNLFQFYNPHITITQIPDFHKAEELVKELDWTFAKFESGSIGLYARGEFGTCNKLIKEFSLR